MAGIIILYGVILGGLASGVKMALPEGKMEVIWTIAAGGALCVFWGVLAWVGHRQRFSVGLTAVAVALVLLHGTVDAWRGGASTNTNLTILRLFFTGMLMLTVAMLMYLLHGERTDAFYRTRTPQENENNRRANPAPRER